MNRPDLSGKRFDRLHVIGPAVEQHPGKGRRWLCLCDCGGTCEPTTYRLQIGATQSCGCFARERLGAKRTRPWTPEEIALLGGGSALSLVKKLERSRNAIQAKRRELGIKVKRIGRKSETAAGRILPGESVSFKTRSTSRS